MLTELVQTGLASVDQLQRELDEGQRRGSRFPRLALEAITAGIRSVPEGLLRQAALERGLHSLRYNPFLYLPDGRFIASPDAYDPATGTAVEVDSQGFPLSGGGLEGDDGATCMDDLVRSCRAALPAQSTPGRP